jgi:hypothetical protein
MKSLLYFMGISNSPRDQANRNLTSKKLGSSGFSVGSRMGCGLVRFELFGLAETSREGDTLLLALLATLLLVPSGGPTSATRPSGRTLVAIGGPCLSAASWLALLVVASVQSAEAGGASLVLGPFAKTKGPRLPGRNPATPRMACTHTVGG